MSWIQKRGGVSTKVQAQMDIENLINFFVIRI